MKLLKKLAVIAFTAAVVLLLPYGADEVKSRAFQAFPKQGAQALPAEEAAALPGVLLSEAPGETAAGSSEPGILAYLSGREDAAALAPALGFYTRTYYYMTPAGGCLPIAEGFGFDRSVCGDLYDFSGYGYAGSGLDEFYADLDGDGEQELITVNVYGGDGHLQAAVFDAQEGFVFRGTVDLNMVPAEDWNNFGSASTCSFWSSGRGEFVLLYTGLDGDLHALTPSYPQDFCIEPYAVVAPPQPGLHRMNIVTASCLQ